MPVYRVPIDLTYPAPGSPGVNIWHYETSADNAPAALEAVSTVLENFYTAIRGAGYANSVAPTFAGVASDVTGGDEVTADPWTIAAGGGSLMPLASAICITWRTGTTARTGVGRTFLGPLSDSVLATDGTPTPAALDAIRAAAATLITEAAAVFPDGQGQMGVYSRVTGQVRAFQAARVRDTFAVLRSRRD